MKTKTNEEIAAEIAALKEIKPRVRKCSAFGDDHHAALDAQVEVLERRMSNDKVYDRFEPTDNEDCDYDEGRSESILNAAVEALLWMNNEAADPAAPSENWKDLTS